MRDVAVASRLDAAVVDHDAVCGRVLVPGDTSIIDLATVCDGLRDGVDISLDQLKCEAHADVPANVAVHEPSTRVVGLEGNDDVATSRGTLRACRRPRHVHNISPRWVDGVEWNGSAVGTSTCDR